MNSRLRELALKASREIDLTYPGDAFPESLAKYITKDLVEEFSKVKWMGDDEGWERAINAVVKELKSRYS